MPIKADIKSILEEYNLRKQIEEKRVEDIIKLLIDKSTEFKKARADYAKSRAGQVKAKLNGRDSNISNAKKEYKDALLKACKENGIHPNDLQIKYTCNECKDTGYVGQVEKKYCNCLINRAVKNVLSSQNLVEDASFDNFDESIFPDNNRVDNEGRSQREHIVHIKQRAISWCNSFPHTKKLQTLFIGVTGVGKSYMVNCIAHEIIKKGYSVVNSKASGINEAMLKVIKEGDSSLISLFKSCDLLIVDDLGAEPLLKNITVETLYDIIEHRLTSKKHTMIVTNLSMKELEDKYGYRISSRISSAKNSALMHMLGEDLRRI